jgi:lipopolysaccharide transport system permease protein
MQSIIGNVNLIKKLHFKRELVVLSAVLSSLITLLLNLAVFFIFWVFLGQPVFGTALFFPLLLAELFVLSLGSAYALSALNARYRDVSHIWEIVSQVGFWITPIIYPLTFIPEPMLKWYMLNPMARIINDARDAILYNGLPSLWHNAITAAICIAIYIAGRRIFKKYSRILGEAI